MAVHLQQTAQIISGLLYFLKPHIAYTSTNKTKIILIERQLFIRGVDMSHVYTHTWMLCRSHSLITITIITFLVLKPFERH